MTKQNFIALADVLRAFEQRMTDAGKTSLIRRDGFVTLTQLTHELASFCHSQNPRFNRERWLGYIAGTNGKNGGKA